MSSVESIKEQIKGGTTVIMTFDEKVDQETLRLMQAITPNEPRGSVEMESFLGDFQDLIMKC